MIYIASLQLHGCSVDVGSRIVREHAYGNVEHFVEFFATAFVSLCHQVHFFEAEELRTGLEQLLGFFYIIRTDGVVDFVIGVAECRIAVAQEGAVQRSIECLEAVILGVEVAEVAVDDFE